MANATDKIKSLIGHMLRPIHSSNDKLASSEAPGPAFISIFSTSFDAGMPIPKRHTQEENSISPELQWDHVPPDARELVLVCEDPDAPKPSPIVHWIVYNIPPSLRGLPEGLPVSATIPGGMRQGRNYSGIEGYIGPMPPLGHGVHHYHFQLFALDQPLHFSESPDRDQLVKAMAGHVLAQGELIGTYERTADD